MKKFVNVITVALLLITSQYVVAAPAWYVGKVKRVTFAGSDGSFIITFKNLALDDCQHKYAYFTDNTLGPDRLKQAYSMALTSVTTGLNMGVVIDKSTNGSGGQCNAIGMAADLRAN